MTQTPTKFAVGVDIGGTHLRAALVDTHGTIQGTLVRHRLEARDPNGVLEAIAAAQKSLGQAAQNAPMGIGVAGQIHTRSGRVVIAPNLHWRNVPFGAMLAQRFSRPVRLVNDLNAITVGEAAFGAGGGANHVICIFVGTGLGMGAVSHGHVIEGHDGLAAELGHIKVFTGEGARACGCGERGCLEAYVSGRHLPQLLQHQVAAGSPSRLWPTSVSEPQTIGADSIEAAAEAGDIACTALWDSVATTLGLAVANIVTVLNTEVLILGGGVLICAPSLKRRVVQLIGDLVAAPARPSLRIVDTHLGEAAGVVGAAILARESAMRDA